MVALEEIELGWHARFIDFADQPPEVEASAGGRVNLIGEHTDYHEGFVMPAAINLRTMALASRRADARLRIRSTRTEGEVQAHIAEPWPPKPGWAGYLLASFWALRETLGHMRPADVVVEGNVPFGGGLSSSASLLVVLAGVALTLQGGREAPLPDRMAIAQLARRAENDYCGVPCGIMDHVACACGKQGHAILLDCRTLERIEVPIPEGWAIVVADSGVKHALGNSEYGLRQRECAQGLQMLRHEVPALGSLRDVSPELLEAWKSKMPDKLFRRLHHVLSENQRVLQARTAMESADAQAMGRLMYASHESLARDYEVSCPELNHLVELAASIPGVIGARLTGAGFGGNTVNLVEAARAEDFRAAIVERFRAKTGKPTRAMIVTASDGFSIRWDQDEDYPAWLK